MKMPLIQPRWLPFIVLCAAVFCYWRTACLTLISYSDSAELMAASYTLGIPHAPGYPLYMLLGKAWSSILGGDVAHRYSLLSGLCGGLTILLVFLIVKELVQSAAAAVLAAASLAFSYHFWLYSLVPEISSLNGLFGALILYWLARQSGKTPNMKVIFGFGVLFSLGLSHHHTLLLWLPALAGYLIFAWPQNQNTSRNFFFLSACVAAGFLPYLYVPLAASFHPVINALHDSSLGGVLKFVTRQNYGSLVLASDYQRLSPEIITASLGFYFHCLLKDFYWSGLLLGLLGIYHLRRRKEGLFILLAFLASGPLLFAISRVPAQTFPEQGVLEKLLSLSLVAWAALIGSGIAWLLAAARKKPFFPVTAAILLLSLPAFWALADNWPKVDKSHFALSRRYVTDLFKCVEPNGVMLIHGDSSLFSTRYLQTVEGFRPDVSIYSAGELANARVIRETIGHRPIYFVGLPGNKFAEMGVNGNPYYLKPRALVFEVTAAPSEYSDDRAVWDSFEFKQGKVSDFEDAYAKETLWFYAIAHFNRAAMILPYHRAEEAFRELQQALDIYPEFPEARRWLASAFTQHGN